MTFRDLIRRVIDGIRCVIVGACDLGGSNFEASATACGARLWRASIETSTSSSLTSVELLVKLQVQDVAFPC